MIIESPIAKNTSIMECCLTKTVDMQINVLKIIDAVTISLDFPSRLLFMIDIVNPMELKQ